MQRIQQVIPPIINGENLLMHPEIKVGIPKSIKAMANYVSYIGKGRPQ